MDLLQFGNNVRLVRGKYLPELSLHKASMKAMISHTQLKRIEAGEWNVTISTLIQIAENWNVPLGEFFKPPDKQPPEKEQLQKHQRVGIKGREKISTKKKG
jgi:transcriptional regulator with XRE-family HTH domain